MQDMLKESVVENAIGQVRDSPHSRSIRPLPKIPSAALRFSLDLAFPSPRAREEAQFRVELAFGDAHQRASTAGNNVERMV